MAESDTLAQAGTDNTPVAGPLAVAVTVESH